MAPVGRSHFTACGTLFFDMRYFKIEHYVSEETFFQNKDVRTRVAAFADCFVVDIHNNARVLAACCDGTLTGCRLPDALELSTRDATALLQLYGAKREPLALACNKGTLLCFPAWRTLGLALVFLLDADLPCVLKSLENAQRYANSPLFEEAEVLSNAPVGAVERQLQTILFYTEQLFGKQRSTDAVAQILMVANLAGCRLHRVAVEQLGVLIRERELEGFLACLLCLFMTMRRFSGHISASDNAAPDHALLRHVSAEYGLCIQQTALPRTRKPIAFDIPAGEDIISFLHHPAFADYTIEATESGICLTLPLGRCAAVFSLSAKAPVRAVRVMLFPV